MPVQVPPSRCDGAWTSRSSLADISLTSLSQRARHHLDNEKQQDDEKRAPAEICDDGSGLLLFHFVLSFILNSISFCLTST